MILTSRVAQNYEKIIKKGGYNTSKMLTDIQCAFDRKLMTLDEKKYLEALVDADIIKDSENQVKQLG